MLKVLFLDTRNMARGPMAEVLVNHLGEGRFQAYSAGFQPRGELHPLTSQTLGAVGIPTNGIASKGIQGFSTHHAPDIDVVISLSKEAAAERCPLWFANPAEVQWLLPDVSVAPGGLTGQQMAFRQLYAQLDRMISELRTFELDGASASLIKAQLETIKV